MNSDLEETDEDRGLSPEKPRSYPSSTQRHNMHRFSDTKICYFYKDGDVNFGGVKLAVSSRLHPTFDALKAELTAKLTDLPFGVRSVFTPRGRNRVTSVSELSNEGRYICSTYVGRARGLDINRVSSDRIWNFAARPPSGKRAFNDLLRNKAADPVRSTPRRHAWVTESDHVIYQTRTPKKIVVVVSGDPGRRQTLLLYRRTLQTFEQVLDDLAEMFEMPVRKMFTMDGRMVKSLSAIYSGPEMYMVTSGERPELWTRRNSESPFEPLEKKRKGRREFATKNKDRRNKMTKTRGKYKVWVTTNELPSAGTTAQVTLTICGHKADSGPIPLGSPDGIIFQAGIVDEFEVSVGNIGDIFKIRISHDNSGDFPGWLCDEVKLQDIDTEEEYVFKCQRWLSRDEDDAEICREIPISIDQQNVCPIVIYDVMVLTGDLWSASTEANVYLTVYGERGDTGVRQLYRGKDTDRFCMGQSDSFTMEAVSLGNLSRVIIGHDGSGPGSGWFLDQVIIKEQRKPASHWVFPCRRWLDEGEDDGKIVRELKLMDSFSEEKYKKELFDHQRWKFQTGSHVVLYSKMSQKPLQIRPDGAVDAKAEEDDDHGVFQILHKRSIYRIFQNVAIPHLHLGLDSSGLVAQTKNSICNEFIIQPQPDSSILLESVRYPRQYATILKDGNPGSTSGKPSEPSRHFFVYCKGMFRDRGIVILNTSLYQTLSVEESVLCATGHHTRSALFRVHKLENSNVRMFESILFPNQFIQIRGSSHCDIKGVGDKMCEFKIGRVKDKDYVTLESVACRGLFIGMTPEGRVRPTVDTGGRNTRFYPEIIEYGIPKNVPLPLLPPPVMEKPRNVEKHKKVTNEKPVEKKFVEMSIDTDEQEESTSAYEDGDWKVWLSIAESAKNADVGLVIYGDKGNSGPIILGSSGLKGLFQADNIDEFKINLQDVGRIFKVRVELTPSNTKQLPTMKLKLVKLQDMKSKEVLRFRFDRWLSREKDDGDIVRELPAIRPKQPVLPVVKYKVQTYTGTLPGSDTDANIYVNLFGEQGDIGRRLLLRSPNETKFLEGQVDTFELEAVSLGELTECHLSHDGLGPGEGWYCQKVVVTDVDTKRKYVFPCDMWLDSSIDDGKTEVVLKVKDEDNDESEAIAPVVAEKDKSDKPKPGDWLLTTITGSQSYPKMQDTVVIYAYGDKGIAGPIELGNGAKGLVFRPGKTDDFKVNFGASLGPLYKIRIGLREENADVSSNWFLEKLKMKSLSGVRDILSFSVNRWMSRKMDDSAVWRELAVSGPGKRPLPLITYKVEVYTGSIPGSDTSAAVFIHIFGGRGDAGKRRLFRSQNEVKFQKGQMDEFEVQAVSLDEISKVIIGHKNKQKGGGWYLEKVIIREGQARVFHLPCRRWMDAGMDDGETERVLFPQKVLSPPATPPFSPPLQLRSDSSPDQVKDKGALWKIWINHQPIGGANSTKRHYSADGVIAVIYGNKGISKELLLTNGETVDSGKKKKMDYTSQLYEREIDSDLGTPYKLRLGLRSSEMKALANLLIKQVKILNTESLEEFVFDADVALVDATAKTGWVEIPLGGKLPVLTYHVEVHTGNVKFAGTNANVHLMIVGERGDTGRRNLQQPVSKGRDKFEAGSIDIFEIRAVDLLKPMKVIVGHDGKGPGSGWFLEKVVVHCENEKHREKTYTFPCERWLDEGKDDGLIERELRLSSDDLDEHDPGNSPKVDSPLSNHGNKLDEKDVWKVYAKTGEFHAAGEDEEEEEFMEEENEEEEEDGENTNNNANSEEERRIRADFEKRRMRKLRARPHPPTGQLLLVVYGNQGKTEELLLEPVNPDDEYMFTSGHLDEFKVKFSEDLGKIYKIRIGFSDDTTEEQNWLLDTLMLEEAETGKKYTFELRNRLIRDEESDGWQEIPLAQDSQRFDDEDDEDDDDISKRKMHPRTISRPLPVLKYSVEVYTGSLPNASTDAHVYVMLVGERGDTGKRRLLKSFTADDRPFRQDQLDIFEIMAVDLLDVKKVIVGHDGKTKGQGWFLEKIAVQVSRDGKEVDYDFDCNRWLDAGLEDGQIERELHSVEKGKGLHPPENKKDKWTVSIATVANGNSPREVVNSDWLLVVCGNKDKSPELRLSPVNPTTQKGKFTPGKTAEFVVDFSDEDLGDVYKVQIGFTDEKVTKRHWFPKELLLKNQKNQKLYKFKILDTKFSKNPFDGWWEIPLTLEKPDLKSRDPEDKPSLPMYLYEVELYTGSRNSEEVSDVHLTLFGERGDTGKRKFQKSFWSGQVDFPTPELLVAKQRMYSEQNRDEHLPNSADSVPAPHPPITKKSEIFNPEDYEEIDRHAETAPLKLSAQSYEALVSYLVKPTKNDVGRVRALFVWIASQRLQEAMDFIGQDLPPSGTPLYTVLLILSHRLYNGYSDLLSKMCSYADIPCKVIKGKVKGAGSWIGKRNTGTNDFCIVYVGGAWRFIDPHWGSSFCIPQFPESDSNPRRPDSVPKLGSWKDAPGDLEDDGRGYARDDFYFLTDPEAFIFTHMSCDPSHQLLAHPVTEEEFWEMAFLREAFFTLEMTTISHPKCILEADDHGAVVLEFGLSKNRKCLFSYKLSKSSVDRSCNSIDGVSLDRFVTLESSAGKLKVTIRFPKGGQYKFELYGRDVQSDEGFMSVCEYAIICKHPDFECEPNPINVKSLWGPGTETEAMGLKVLEPLGGTVIAVDGEARVKFRLTSTKEMFLHGILTSGKLVLTKCVCHFKTDLEVTFLLKLPHSGTFLLEIFSRETKQSDTFRNICNYLVKSEQSLSSVESFFPMVDGFGLIGDQTTRAGKLRLKPVSHLHPVINISDRNDLDITMSASSKDSSFHLKFERFVHREAEAENLSEYAYLRQTRELVLVSLNCHKPGFYKLSIYSDSKPLYIYLISVRNPDVTSSPFPVRSPDWKSHYAILKPRTGHLDAGSEYLFRVKVPGAEDVHLEMGDVTKELSRAGNGGDVWEASVKTSREGGTLKVFSEDRLLLTYKVLRVDEVQREKQQLEKSLKMEISQRKKLVAVQQEKVEKERREKSMKVKDFVEDFNRNRETYERREALLQWREEDAMEKYLSKGNKVLPIEPEERFSEKVHGMLCKVNKFHLVAVDLLDIQRVVVGHSRNEVGEGWFLQKAVVRVWSNDGLKIFTLPCNRWLERGVEDGRVERELVVKEKLPAGEGSWWKVFVKTGDPTQTDKDNIKPAKHQEPHGVKRSTKSRTNKDLSHHPPTGQLQLVIYGDRAKTELLSMTMVKPDDPDAFDSGHVDEFKVRVEESLGSVYKIRIGFEGSTTDHQNWLLDNVIIEDPATSVKYRFDFRDRFVKDEGSDGWLEASVRPTLPGKALTESAFIEEMSLKPTSVVVYRVEVYTGNLEGAGTTADISVMLIGERGDSGWRRLLKSLAKNPVKFSEGQMDIFEVEVVDLLDVRKVIVGCDESGSGQDESGSGQGWFLDKIVVKANTKKGVEEYDFTCGRWIFEEVENGRAETSLLRDDLRVKKDDTTEETGRDNEAQDASNREEEEAERKEEEEEERNEEEEEEQKKEEDGEEEEVDEEEEDS